MNRTPLLDARRLTKFYGGVRAVNEVSLSLNEGEVLGLVGPNGAGKTTLMDLLSGTQRSDSGTINLNGKLLLSSPYSRAQAGFARTFQHPQIAGALTVRENLLLGVACKRNRKLSDMVRELFAGGLRSNDPADSERAEELAEEVNLTGLDRQAGDLTLGEQRLLEVGRALGQRPKVLLLDEPFAGADTNGIDGIVDAVTLASSKGCGVILVDHNVDLVASLATRMLLLEFGTVAFEGDPQKCMASPDMNRVYFGVEEEL